MAITISPITPNFVAEIFDVDLTKPLIATDIDAIKAAFWKYSVLIFTQQNLNQDQQLAFASLFGPEQTSKG